MKTPILALLTAALILGPAAFDTHAEETMKLTLESSAFENGGAIPSKYTSDGADVSPHGDAKCAHCAAWFNVHGG